MADAIVYDQSNTGHDDAQVFVRKDALDIMDSQQGNYLGNQCVIDTSQLSNSNKFMDYRNAYLSVPLLLTLSGLNRLDIEGSNCPGVSTLGLKNWFGNIVNSMTLDYAGTTIIQNTNLCNLNTMFELLTTMSMSDVLMNGSTIGFYPDTTSSIAYCKVPTASGSGTVNNMNFEVSQDVQKNGGDGTMWNNGFLQRQNFTNYSAANHQAGLYGSEQYSSLYKPGSNVTDTSPANSILGQLRRSYISMTKNAKASAGKSNNEGFIQTSIMAIIYLKHLHSFFANMVLCKGVFFRLTLNLNQPTVVLTNKDASSTLGKNYLAAQTITSPLGGTVPFMVAAQASATGTSTFQDADVYKDASVFLNYGLGLNKYNMQSDISGSYDGSGNNIDFSPTISLAVGNQVLNSAQKSAVSSSTGQVGSSVHLHVDAYTFNPTFEAAYLSMPVRTIVYTDIFQFTTPMITKNSSFQQLITNGLANVKSVLVIPFYDAINKDGTGTAAEKVAPPFQSVFDSAPCTTSPEVNLTQFQVTVAGQNMIYNQTDYTYQFFLDQVAGVNSINANMVDGLTSGFLSFKNFHQGMNYYYVNTSRMLPVDEAVPKSIMISGTNQSAKDIKLYVFCTYGVQVSIDLLTGSRV